MKYEPELTKEATPTRTSDLDYHRPPIQDEGAAADQQSLLSWPSDDRPLLTATEEGATPSDDTEETSSTAARLGSSSSSSSSSSSRIFSPSMAASGTAGGVAASPTSLGAVGYSRPSYNGLARPSLQDTEYFSIASPGGSMPSDYRCLPASGATGGPATSPTSLGAIGQHPAAVYLVDSPMTSPSNSAGTSPEYWGSLPSGKSTLCSTPKARHLSAAVETVGSPTHHHPGNSPCSASSYSPCYAAAGASSLAASTENSDEEEESTVLLSGKEYRRGRPRADELPSLMKKGSKSPSSIKCKICNRVFPRGKSLQAHERTHLGIKPFQCDYPGCTKSFAQTGQLNTHKRLHTGEKPFMCSVPGCEIRYTHANRHCSNHPHASLIRSPNPVLQQIRDNLSPEVIAWLEKEKAKAHKTPSKRRLSSKTRSDPQVKLEQENLEVGNGNVQNQEVQDEVQGKKKRRMKSRKVLEMGTVTELKRSSNSDKKWYDENQDRHGDEDRYKMGDDSQDEEARLVPKSEKLTAVNVHRQLTSPLRQYESSQDESQDEEACLVPKSEQLTVANIYQALASPLRQYESSQDESQDEEAGLIPKSEGDQMVAVDQPLASPIRRYESSFDESQDEEASTVQQSEDEHLSEAEKRQLLVTPVKQRYHYCRDESQDEASPMPELNRKKLSSSGTCQLPSTPVRKLNERKLPLKKRNFAKFTQSQVKMMNQPLATPLKWDANLGDNMVQMLDDMHTSSQWSLKDSQRASGSVGSPESSDSDSSARYTVSSTSAQFGELHAENERRASVLRHVGKSYCFGASSAFDQVEEVRAIVQPIEQEEQTSQVKRDFADQITAMTLLQFAETALQLQNPEVMV